MSGHDVRSLVYHASGTGTPGQDGGREHGRDGRLDVPDRILRTLARQAMRERTPDMDELESALRESAPGIEDAQADGRPFTELLYNMGYVRDERHWLTRRGFDAVGGRMLRDIMNGMESSRYGLHEAARPGDGGTELESTKRLEPGDGIVNLSVQHTILNAVRRICAAGQRPGFPIDIRPDDLEAYEMLEDVRAAVVYCIDLSSTMRTKLGENTSRLEAAKKALWVLYMLNKKFFPGDHVFIVGFASLAFGVRPADIPFLKTYGAGDNFLHYTNYQAALRLSERMLRKVPVQNKRIVLITDGQPSACFVDNESQKADIFSDKPYSKLYSPDVEMISRHERERGVRLDADPGRLVYLCYRHKKVDSRIDERTVVEARRCAGRGIRIDSIVVSNEEELLDYAMAFEKDLKGRTYHIRHENMDRVLVRDYLSNTRRTFGRRLR